MSPTIFREKGYRFFFFSREEERMHVHVHVLSADSEAKFWLMPELELAKNHRLSRQQLRQIESILEAHFDELIGAWRQHFED